MTKKILTGIWMMVLSLMILLINSANYLLYSWGELDFSTVLYQLNSNLSGTNIQTMMDYMVESLVPTIFEIFLLVFFCFYWKKFTDKIRMTIKVRVGTKHLTHEIGKRYRRNCLLLFVTVCVSFLTVLKAYQVGIPKYIEDITNVSTIFEDKYVDPNSIDIVFHGDKKNLIYIFLESMETTFASEDVGGGKKENYIPNLTRLAEENVYFSATDKMGGLFQTSGAGWTMAALLTSTSGVPYLMPIEENSAGDYDTILPGLTTMGEVLEDAGYKNYFMCGSNAEFSGRAKYFEQHGNYEIIDYYTAIADGAIAEDYSVFWGMEDQKLYDYAKDKLVQAAADGQPFNFTMLTVDTHYPNGYMCTVCDTEYEEQYENVITCADHQIMEFLNWIQEQAWYKDTVVVLVGDHLSMNEDFWRDLPEGYERGIYNCFINSGLDVVDKKRIASNLDLMPTILTAIGADIEGNRLGLGTNLFSEEPTLAEVMGKELFMSETSRYSEMYNEQFVKGK